MAELLDPRVQPFVYDLPEHLIARRPPTTRDGGRLLLLRGDQAEHRRVVDLPDLLQAGDLLVVNDVRVRRARLYGRRSSGGAVELLITEETDGGAWAQVRPARRLREGEEIELLERKGGAGTGLSLRAEARAPDGGWRWSGPVAEAMARFGAVPLPPYLGRDAEPDDEDRYQTVFADRPAAAAAPTAGLHLSGGLLDALQARGVRVARLTLEVGIGTFRNLRPDDLEAGALHPERFHISPETAAEVEAARARGGRVVAIGTTSTRALEAAAAGGGLVRPGSGETRLFLRPGDPFRVVDLLFTNLHLPGSSLLMLVCAFGGHPRVMAAYAEAVAERYRFFSYGDAMLVHPARGRAGGGAAG